MKGSKYGQYCTVNEAAQVLGMYPEDVRNRMKRGTLQIGDVIRKDKRTVFEIERSKVLKLAGLTEWPLDLVTEVATKRAARAARQITKEGGDTERIAAILRDCDVITLSQYKAMMGVAI